MTKESVYIVRYKGDKANFEKASDEVIAKLGEVNRKAGKSTLGAEMFDIAGKNALKMATGIGVAAGAMVLLDRGWDNLVAFDRGLRNINTILNLSQKDLKQYGTELKAVQTQLGLTAEDATNAAYEAHSAGIGAGEGIEFVTTSAKAAKAGLTETKVAVDGLTTVLNAFHLETEKTGKVADVMFQTVNLGKTTFPELASSLSNVASIAAASGVEFEEVAGAIATLTKQGVPTAEATTQIRAAIVGLNEVLGDGWAKSMSLQDAMKLIAERADGSQTKLSKMLGRIEGVNAVLAMTGENTKMASSDLEAMAKAGGSLEKAFAEQSQSIEAKSKRMWSAIDSGSSKFIGLVAPAITEAFEGIAEAIDVYSGDLSVVLAMKAQKSEGERLAGQIEFLKGTTEEYRKKLLQEAEAQRVVYNSKLLNVYISKEDEKQVKINIEAIDRQIKALKNYKELSEKDNKTNAEKGKSVREILHTQDDYNRKIENLQGKLKSLTPQSEAWLNVHREIKNLQEKMSPKFVEAFGEGTLGWYNQQVKVLEEKLNRLSPASKEAFDIKKRLAELDGKKNEYYIDPKLKINQGDIEGKTASAFSYFDVTRKKMAERYQNKPIWEKLMQPVEVPENPMVKMLGGIEDEQARWEESKALTMDSLGQMSDAFSTFYNITGSKNKEFFAMYKMFAIAKAGMAAKESVVQAYKAGTEIGGPPVGIAFATAAGLFQASQIAAIATMQPGSSGSGASIGGGATTIPNYSNGNGSSVYNNNSSSTNNSQVVININGDYYGDKDKLVRSLSKAINNAIDDGIIVFNN